MRGYFFQFSWSIIILKLFYCYHSHSRRSHIKHYYKVPRDLSKTASSSNSSQIKFRIISLQKKEPKVVLAILRFLVQSYVSHSKGKATILNTPMQLVATTTTTVLLWIHFLQLQAILFLQILPYQCHLRLQHTNLHW